jgi:hypothetical protein
MAGKSFMVTVQAPNAPCIQTQNKVTQAQAGDMGNSRRWRHVMKAKAKIKPPTPVAK